MCGLGCPRRGGPGRSWNVFGGAPNLARAALESKAFERAPGRQPVRLRRPLVGKPDPSELVRRARERSSPVRPSSTVALGRPVRPRGYPHRVTDIDIELPALLQIVVLGITVVIAKVLWRRPIWSADDESPR